MPSGNPAVRAATEKTEWRSARKQGILVTLPSGNTASLKRTLDLAEMIKEGKIPNPLTETMNKMLEAGGKPTKIDTSDPELLISMIQFINAQCARIFVEPAVEVPPDIDHLDEDPRCADWTDEHKANYDPNAWEPEDEATLSVLDIDFDDQMFAFAFAQGASADLATFRDQRAAYMAGGADGAAVQDAPVTPGGGG